MRVMPRTSCHAVLAGLLALMPVLSQAAGSFERADIVLFQPGQNDRYSLIVKRSTSAAAADPPGSGPLALCREVRIFGSFDTAHWANQAHSTVTREGHREALAYFARSAVRGQAVNLGEVGQGLRVANKSMPCTFKSRGLIYWKTATEEVALSVFHAL